ncbi:trypsin-like peptidase domain-containing protein [Streptomyces tanashiensis]|uniref:trypsin-like peptidase domain-containing protein n=1 Tax=Streptomyces tanashiensis TaxID=67367 RepID=UPI00341144A0
MELGRIAAVLLPGTSGYAGNGSGYLLGPRLVLTARHVLADREECAVQVPGGRPVRCRTVWRGGTTGGADVDAALLLADEDVREQVAPVRWGRLVTTRHQPCDVAGYPDAGRRADGGLDLQQPRAVLSPGTAALSHRYTVELAARPAPSPGGRAASPWSGQSGAALFCGAATRGLPLLTGVVVTDVTGWGLPRWEAVPVYALLADPDFVRLVTHHTGVAPVPEPVDLQGVVAPDGGWQVRSPATLLDQRAEVVRFHGREALLDRLTGEWCSGDGVRLAVITGPGGAGKSRLARELGARLRDRHGWVGGVLDDRGPDGDLGVLAEVDRPLYLVADYAELRIAQLTALLGVLDRRPPGRPPVRLLLTARGRGEDTGGWWDQLRTRTRETRSLTYDAFHHELPPLTGSPDRDGHFRDALVDLARRLPEALPRTLREATGDWTERVRLVAPRDLGAPAYGSALTLHMTALADLLATHPATRPRGAGLDVEEQLLLHERAYWEDTAAARPPLAAAGPVRLADAVGSAVLGAGARPALARPLFRSSPGFRGADDTVAGLGAAWLAELYPALGDTCWGALQPDRLGEYHVGERARADAGLVTLPLVTLATAGSDLREAAATGVDPLIAALVTVSRVGALPRHWEPVARGLDAALALAPSLAARIMHAAALTEHAAPLVDALHRLTDAPATDPGLLLSLLDTTSACRSRVLTGWATRTAALAARGLPPVDRAAALLHEAVWRQTAGDHAAAVFRCKEALRLLESAEEAGSRSTAAHGTAGPAALTPPAVVPPAPDPTPVDPAVPDPTPVDPAVPDPADPSAARPPAVDPWAVVETLTVLARSYRVTASFEEAHTVLDSATGRLDALPATDPRTRRAEAELLGERARLHVGQKRDAVALPLQERRVELLTAMTASGDPGLLERLADAEAELAIALSRLGRNREAAQTFTEAPVQALLQQADERPDTLGHDAVGSLVGRANRLRALGRYEESYTVMRQALAVVDRPEGPATPWEALALATVLNNLGATLLVLDRPEEALEPIERGLRIRRGLAAAAGSPGEPLWSSLFQYSGVLEQLGRVGEAREVLEECLAVSAELVRLELVHPRIKARTQAVLAEMLWNGAAADPGTDHRQDLIRALKLLGEATDLYHRSLDELQGDQLAEFVLALTATVHIYLLLGRDGFARFAWDQLLSVRRLMTHHDPEQHGGALVGELREAADHHERVGQLDRALELYGEAVSVRRFLLDRSGSADDRLRLAVALAEYAGPLARAGRHAEALPHLVEAALESVRSESGVEPARYAFVTSALHQNFADTLPWLGCFDEALQAVAAAEAVIAPFAATHPEAYAREMRDCASLRAAITRAEREGLQDLPESRGARRDPAP